jgi:hypothetical protein
MDKDRKILALDAILHVDVRCYSCERGVALSNAYMFDGRYYCKKCDVKLGLSEKILSQIKYQ